MSADAIQCLMKMRNPLLVILFVLISINTYTQIKEFKLGVKCGANFQYGQHLEDSRVFDGKILYHAGITSEFIIGIKKKFSIQAELLYSAQGFSETYYYNPVYQQHQFKDEVFINVSSNVIIGVIYINLQTNLIEKLNYITLEHPYRFQEYKDE